MKYGVFNFVFIFDYHEFNKLKVPISEYKYISVYLTRYKLMILLSAAIWLND